MKKTVFTALILVGMIGVSQAAPHHPRRAEVNRRLLRQDGRIDEKEADGKMSAKEAGKLHHEDHQIRQEERDMASQNHSHITKREQKTLNQQENKTSKKIGS